jgi:hypothetical protein
MIEETKETHEYDNATDISDETSLVPSSGTSNINLSTEAQKLINALTIETDAQKTQAIEQRFNEIQRKKQLARVSKLSDVQDMLTDQFYKRISQRPDEISNKEMLDGMKVVQDLMEKSQKQTDISDIPQLIQINQTEVNVGGNNNLNRDSRERVKNVVIDLLNSITNNTITQPEEDSQDIIETDFVEEDNND